MCNTGVIMMSDDLSYIQTTEEALLLPDGYTLLYDLTKLDLKKKFYYFMHVTAKILSKKRYYQLAAETKAYVQI